MSETAKPAAKKEAKKPVKRTRSRNPLPTKVVIRHLPPTLTSEQFTEQISPIADHNYFYYVRGDPLLGEFSFSRAYINFINQDDILHFREKFDNFVFVDDKGNEYTAIVELALYQGAPKRRKKVDPKHKTIENDPDFLHFVENKENLNKPDVLPSVQECLEEIETKANKQETKITPLLEYINNAEHRKVTEIKKKPIRDDGREKRRKEERVRKRKEKERDRKKPSGSKPAVSSKGVKEQSAEMIASAHPISIKVRESKENREEGAVGGVSKEPKKRERHRRRYEDKKLLKSNDDRPEAESKHGEKDRPEKERPEKFRPEKVRSEKFRPEKSRPSNKNTAGNASGSTTKKEEPQTFTVRILKNEHRNEPKSSDSSAPKPSTSKESTKSEKSTDGASKDRRPPEKIRNKDRPTIQIYRPTPRLSVSQSKDNKDQKESATKKPSQSEKSARRGS